MAQLRQIKKRMIAVRTIQRITKTMQMIATAKFTAAMARAKASRPYVDRIREMVTEVAAAAGDANHPLMSAPRAPSGKDLVLVIASDRGLCGAYNGHVLRTAMGRIRELRGAKREVQLETSGKKAVGYFRFAKVPITARHSFGDRPKFEEVEKLGDRLIEDFTSGTIDSVRVVSMKFISNSRQVPEVMQLLPMTLPGARGAGDPSKAGASGGAGAEERSPAARSREPHALYEFSPSSAELLDDLLPRCLKVSLYQAFMDAIVSENVMRMVAMKAATDNAGGLGRTLRRSYNRARQARITTELTEIVSGAAALE
ncbi:MAG: ATP synthase F1 subunit gamma [Phycisphaerae bacterium]|nr:ATP synthase F1 subunit gamma [Phycisphaerae bacterium]